MHEPDNISRLDSLQISDSLQVFLLGHLSNCCSRERLVDHAMESIFIAVLVFMDVSPHASASRFKFFESHCESSRSEPLSVELRVCVSFEDELARCVELSCNEELLLARFSSNFCLTHFFSPPFESFFFSASNSLSKAS